MLGGEEGEGGGYLQWAWGERIARIAAVYAVAVVVYAVAVVIHAIAVVAMVRGYCSALLQRIAIPYAVLGAAAARGMPVHRSDLCHCSDFAYPDYAYLLH